MTELLEKLESNINNRLSIIHALVISFIPAVLSILYHHRGIAHPEIYNYLPHYLSKKPLLSILFDSKILDMDMYQARELSYFFDYIDSKFIEFCTRLGYPHFISITTYVFLLMIGLLIWHYSVKVIRLTPLTGTVILLLYWTSPSIFLAGDYFRSSKNGVALTGALLFFLLYKFFNAQKTEADKNSSIKYWAAFFGIALAATLFDRQGVYFVAMAIFFVLFWNLIFPDKKNVSLLGALSASLAFSLLYNYWFAPLLTEYFNHYQPNFLYQQIPWHRLFNDPAGYFLAGTSLYIDTLRFMLGNIPTEIVMAGIILTAVLIIRKFLKEKKSNIPISKSTFVSLGLLLTNMGLLIGLNTIMVLKHPPLLWLDVRRVYYWIPQTVILFMTLALYLSTLHIQTLLQKQLVAVLLVSALLGNVTALPQHKSYLLNGHLEKYYEFTPSLLDALANLENHQYQASVGVLQNPIYQFFHTSPAE